MAQSRIDSLRHLVADIGRRQVDYWRFFPKFADRLESELGEYMGDRTCVALSCASGEFSFDQGSYRHEGLGFERGRFRIPLMFRLKNLEDEGDLLVRISVFLTLKGHELSAQIADTPVLRLSAEDATPLLEYIYQHLRRLFATENWFNQPGVDYGGTAIGFLVGKN